MRRQERGGKGGEGMRGIEGDGGVERDGKDMERTGAENEGSAEPMRRAP